MPERLARACLELQAVRAVTRAGLLRPANPARLVRAARALRQFGQLGGGITVAALMHPKRTAIVDDAGRWGYPDLDGRSNALARRLRTDDLGDGRAVGILCRNHSGAMVAAYGAAKAGSRTVLLNSGSAPPQLRDVAAREGLRGFIVDDDLAPLLDQVADRGTILHAWRDNRPPLEDEIAGFDRGPVEPPAGPGSLVILTSGTTGTPKGAPRQQPRSFLIPGALLDRIPFRARQTVVVPAPVFHGTGFTLAALNLALGSTLVMRRRFDAEQTLADLRDERADGLVVVPVMLQRLMALGPDAIAAAGLHLQVIFCAGSQLTGALATAAMDAFGDVIYNLYGSTEVSYATIATPADLRAAPGCAGKVALGARVRLLDEEGRGVPAGQVGRIFVGNTTAFEGYTDGTGKAVIDGLMSSGDIGRFDSEGRLFIEGRDDEMIVSGGENVFPHEVEEVLASHPAVAEAAVTGAEDGEFGQRLVAFVVAEGEVTETQLKDLVRNQLARYKIPREVRFVDALPRNASGKVVKRELSV